VEAFLTAPPPHRSGTLVFCHNDLGIEHILIAPATGTITGVIDWGDAALADPARDFGLLYRDLGPAALATALTAYRTGDTAGLAWFCGRSLGKWRTAALTARSWCPQPGGPGVQPQPSVIVFDVNETLSDMKPLARRFSDIGAPELLAKVWFAAVLRDGFALTAAGGKEAFSRLADGALRWVLADAGLGRPASGAVDHVLSGFAELSVHPEVPEGVRLLRQHGLRLVTLSNGSAQVARRLLGQAGILGEFEALLSVDDADAWKPAPAAYGYAARRCAVSREQMLLVAVHPWDIHGAHRAGLATGWIARQEAPYPDYFAAPGVQAPDLVMLAQQIVS
jgi:2-haloacid dehalogenase